MKKNYVLLFLALIFFSKSYGQQPAQYSLYMLNPYGVNPAAAGLKGTLEATGAFRSQWVGIEGNPVSQYLNVGLPLSIISSGIGVAVQNESIGARSGINAKVSYNYILKMGEGQLSAGLSGGVIQGTLNASKLRTPTGDYSQGVIDHKDKLLDIVSINGIAPTLDLGVYYRNEKFEGGISIMNLTQPQLQLKGPQEINVSLKRNYLAMASTHFNISNNFILCPSILIKSDGVETQMDFSTFVRYNDNIFIGTTFRGYSKNSQDALVWLGGLKLNPKVTLAYSYDYTLSALKTIAQGTHEIVLQYNLGKEFGKGKLPPIIYNPRF